MTTVGTYEAKARLPELLQRVKRGEKILITRHGNPAAMLVPAPTTAEIDVRHVVQQMLEYRAQKKRTLGKLRVRDLIEEGRRF